MFYRNVLVFTLNILLFDHFSFLFFYVCVKTMLLLVLPEVEGLEGRMLTKVCERLCFWPWIGVLYSFLLVLSKCYFCSAIDCTVNTKVDMRFNVEKAYWLSEWVRERILQMVCGCES